MNEARCNKRKNKYGKVVSKKMQKTLVVKVEYVEQHPVYKKVVKRAKKYYVHCPSEEIYASLNEGDFVAITETRPISKLKCWRVDEKAVKEKVNQ